MNRIKLEICCGGIEDVKAIKDLPIDRIELNSALELGGLTPDLSCLKAARSIYNGPIMTMLRNMPGFFNYSEEELACMYASAKELLANGSDGLVFGILDENGDIAEAKLKPFIALSKKYAKSFVFHKAFDFVSDDDRAIEQLIALGVDRILLMGRGDLTSCSKRLFRLNQKYGTKIDLLAGGGLSEDNIKSFIESSGVKSVHGTFKKAQYDPLTKTERYYVSPERVNKIISLIK